MAQLLRTGGSIVGRSLDIRAVRDELEQGRMVSLIGPGGVGKTALAAELINELEPDFDRVVTVELAEAEGGEVMRLLGPALLGRSPGPETSAEVLAGLAACPTLLVIDNCEHLIDEVAAVTADVLASGDTKVLATSRRPLDIAGEVIWTVEPLSVPRRDRADRDLTSAEAVQLFLERVRQAVPTFELTDANRTLVADVCLAADGVPLVLELAAALVRRRPLDEILRAMTERPDGLITSRRDRPRHQRSLQSSLEWSRRFLPPDDARLLDRLSAFVGGFTSAAARSVDPDGTADGLARLVDHSLVGFDPDGGRYRMLEVVRLHTEGRMDQAERRAAHRAHFEACLDIGAQIAAGRYDADPDNVFPRFELELANLGAALRRRLEENDLKGFRALLGPIAVWWVHYLAPEDPEVWREAFDRPGIPIDWQANVSSALSFYWSHRGDPDRSLEHASRAIDLHRRAGKPIGWSLDELAAGNAHLARGERDEARAAYDRALEVALTSGHPYPELAVRVSLARLDPSDDRALAHLTTAKALAPGFGAIEAAVTTELGLQALRKGRMAEARRLCGHGLDLARRNGYAEIVGSALCGQAEVELADGAANAAAGLYEEALAVGRRSVHRGVVDQAGAGLARITDRADRADEADRADGADTADLPATDRTDRLPVELSDRELSVARLLRGDLTQREIADELYIAPSTVKTHIKSIYRKLNVTKRSYAVTRAAELGLFD